ncbi:MAG: thioredoxin family protein [Thioalkalivibrionaceae bacterium]
MPGDDTVSPSSYFNRLEPVTTLQQSRRWLLRTATGMALAGLIGSPRRGRSQTHPNYRLPETRDLATLREQHPGKGVLLAFFMDGCAFCHEIDRTYLGVMHDHVDYRDRIVMRHVRLHRHARLIGFDGRKTGVTAFAETLRVRVTPTVVAFDADGGVVGSPLVGIRNVEFYGFDLDRLIDAATRNVS